MSDDFDLPTITKKKAIIPRKNEAAAKNEPDDQVEIVEKVEAKSSQPEYDKDELLKIFDDIIFQGEYIEEIVLRGRVPIKFATRSVDQINKIQDTLDAAGYQLISSVESRRTILNLEQALVSYNGRDLAAMKDAERTKFVASLPSPVVGLLLVELDKFDMKIAAACREEANF